MRWHAASKSSVRPNSAPSELVMTKTATGAKALTDDARTIAVDIVSTFLSVALGRLPNVSAPPELNRTALPGAAILMNRVESVEVFGETGVTLVRRGVGFDQVPQVDNGDNESDHCVSSCNESLTPNWVSRVRAPELHRRKSVDTFALRIV